MSEPGPAAEPGRTTDPGPAEPATLDALIELLTGDNLESDTAGFYDRVCEALCRLTSLERAGLVLYDPIRAIARAAGQHGADSALVTRIQANLEETPMAQEALATGKVVVASGDLHGQVPDRYADLVKNTSVACGPVAAGGHWFGVIIADWNGARAELPEPERQTMQALGRLAALAGSVERATRQRERAGRLNERIALIRDIHDQVIQRLFGLSMVLESGQTLSTAERERCAEEIRGVLTELRTALGRPVSAGSGSGAGGAAVGVAGGAAPSTTLRRILEGQADGSGLTIHWPESVKIPVEMESLAQSFAVEALRNAQRHADAETIEFRVSRADQALELVVINDGVGERDSSGAGLGLRLLTLEALQHNGLVEFGPMDRGRWRARLLVPVESS